MFKILSQKKKYYEAKAMSNDASQWKIENSKQQEREPFAASVLSRRRRRKRKRAGGWSMSSAENKEQTQR